MERLAGAGLAQGLVSSGDGTRVRREIQALGLERFFGVLVPLFPFIGLQIIGLAIVLFFPDVAMWLPNLLK